MCDDYYYLETMLDDMPLGQHSAGCLVQCKQGQAVITRGSLNSDSVGSRFNMDH